MEFLRDPAISALIAGLGGALITSIISIILNKYNENSKRIDCFINEVKPLLSISDKIKEKISITFNGNNVKSAYLTSILINHSGNSAIKNQPVVIQFPEETQIIDYTIRTFPEINFGDIQKQNSSDNILSIKINLLNKKEKIYLDIYTIDNPNDKVDVGLKHENVIYRIYNRKSIENILGSLGNSNFIGLLSVLSLTPLLSEISQPILNYMIMKKINSEKDLNNN